MRNQHACLGRLGKLFVPLGANLLGGSRHRFDRVPGRLGEQGVRTVHVDQIFRARIVAERSVLGLQQEVVPVERIDGAAKRGTKSALLSCSFWGWRLLIACVRACVRKRERMFSPVVSKKNHICGDLLLRVEKRLLACGQDVLSIAGRQADLGVVGGDEDVGHEPSVVFDQGACRFGIFGRGLPLQFGNLGSQSGRRHGRR